MKNIGRNKLVIYTGNILFMYCLLLISEILFRQYHIVTTTENPLISKDAYAMVYEDYYLAGGIVAAGSIVNLIFKLLRWHLMSALFGLLLVVTFFLITNGVL